MQALKNFIYVVFGLLVAASSVSAETTTTRKPILVSQYLSENHPWFESYVTENAPDEFYRVMEADSGLFIFPDFWSFDGENNSKYCVVSLGITRVRDQNSDFTVRVPRYPGYGAGVVSQGVGLEGESGCYGRALKNALNDLFDKDVEKIKKGLSQDSSKSSKRPVLKRDTNQTSYTSVGISDVGIDFIHEKLPAWFPTVFDNRYTNLFVAYKRLIADDGQQVCFGSLGLVNSAPPNLNPHYPRETDAVGRLVPISLAEKAGQDDYCFNPIMERLASKVALDSPVVTKYLANWKQLGEPDLKPITEADVQARYNKWQAAQEKAEAAAAKREQLAAQREEREAQRQRNANPRSTCTNNCYNGDCVRTLANGKKERWQAPHRYNALSGNWEWDTTTNACGN